LLSTRIQSGKHLGACLFYIDLNMVRAGVVNHPSQWEYGSFNEFIEKTQRCCIINKEQLLKCLCFDDNFSLFREWYLATLEEELSRIERVRQAFWSQAVAVGDEEWLYGEAKAMRIKKAIVSQANNEQYYLGKA
jgi:REP-associated tyrosine transposase